MIEAEHLVHHAGLGLHRQAEHGDGLAAAGPEPDLPPEPGAASGRTGAWQTPSQPYVDTCSRAARGKHGQTQSGSRRPRHRRSDEYVWGPHYSRDFSLSVRLLPSKTL